MPPTPPYVETIHGTYEGQPEAGFLPTEIPGRICIRYVGALPGTQMLGPLYIMGI